MQKIVKAQTHSCRLARLVEAFPCYFKSKQILVNALEFEPLIYAKPSVAVIGTRHPSTWGRLSARWLVSQLSVFDVNIVSGGAMGIDAAAHLAALEFGLSTQAWVVGPNAKPSPRSNHHLFARLVQTPGCAVLTPLDLEPHGPSKPLKHHWIMRNAWLVASADAVVVIEANEKSGTWASVKIAADLGINVYALPGPSKNPQSHGTNKMISMGYAMPVDLKEILTNCLLDAHMDSSYNLICESGSDVALGSEENVAKKAQFLPETVDMKLRSTEGYSLEECYRDPELAAKVMELLKKGALELAGNRIFRRD